MEEEFYGQKLCCNELVRKITSFLQQFAAASCLPAILCRVERMAACRKLEDDLMRYDVYNLALL